MRATITVWFAMGLIACADGAAANLLVDGSFESGTATAGGVPTTFGNWSGDQISYVPAENGITPPDGSKMLRFIYTNAGGPAGPTNSSQYFQNIDLSPYAGDIASGTVTVSASAMFNRILGDAQTDTAFGFILDARIGTPSASASLTQTLSTIVTDGDPNTWQTHALNSFILPSGTTFLRFELDAFENIFNDAGDPEFDGHYADNVVLTISVPESGSCALGMIGATSLLAWKPCWRRNRRLSGRWRGR